MRKFVALLFSVSSVLSCFSLYAADNAKDNNQASVDVVASDVAKIEGVTMKNAEFVLSSDGKSAAVYGELVNNSGKDIEVVGAASGNFVAAIHESSTDKAGVTTMSPVATLNVANNASVKFERGGKHIMLTGLNGKPSGGNVVITLKTNEGQFDVEVPVKK